MIYYSTKIVELGSCAFRQPFASSHCKFLHGYRLIAKFTFACQSLDINNWVVDFGCVKELKDVLQQQFDHTTVVWSKDPQLELFKLLNERGVVDLRVMEDGVGIEKFAEYCFNTANKWISNLTNGRCWVKNVEVWENENNSAKVKMGSNFNAIKEIICEEKQVVKEAVSIPVDITQPVKNTVGTPSVSPQTNKPSVNAPVPAQVGNKLDSSPHLGFKKVLDGVRWGSLNAK